MAAEILTQSESFAELATLYSEKAVAEAHARLQAVLEFKSLKPKTVHANCCRVPSPAVEGLARQAGVSSGTLWRCEQVSLEISPGGHCKTLDE